MIYQRLISQLTKGQLPLGMYKFGPLGSSPLASFHPGGPPGSPQHDLHHRMAEGFFSVAFDFLGNTSNIPFLSVDTSGTTMNSLVSWQLTIFLCAVSFRETLEKATPMENPRATGPRLRPPALLASGAQSPRCAERKPAAAGPSPRGASLCPPPESSAGPQLPGLCAPRSRLIPAPRGAVLVQREKDLSAYNWNSFGLRYGRRHTAPPGSRGQGAGRG
ncbi:vesicle transport protein GOT1A isoform X2 [Sagmatias obliquidens]|uniref:vesicle transport protein GOT1A isoform X2 n=1 Tax=Sagmatias obliquidens TaxID=3371155 RepID=UPI000F445978|nr:metastasis-suppressor KiSS-1 isoform X2 [Lagenorhynchus obliquidens]